MPSRLVGLTAALGESTGRCVNKLVAGWTDWRPGHYDSAYDKLARCAPVSHCPTLKDSSEQRPHDLKATKVRISGDWIKQFSNQVGKNINILANLGCLPY